MSGLVKVGEIPYTDVDLSGITAGAGNLRTVASAVRDGTADIKAAWTPISQSYEGPSDEQLFAAMDPIVPQGTAFGDDLDTVAKALDDFVTEVTPIVAKLKTYVTRGNQLHTDVAQHDGAWDEDETLNGENNDIINGVANQVVAYQAAERTCANTIRGLSGLAALHAMTGDDPDDELGYGYSELPMGTELPWGTAEARKESCGEKTLYFVPHLLQGVVVDGIWGTVQGLGQLVGLDGTGWHLDTLTNAWKGMGSLIGYSAADDSWSWGNAGDAWKGLGKATVGWDAWADDPGRAAGQAVWGIGSLLIPVAGEVGKVGALGKVGEVAGTVGKAGRVLDLVDAGAWASRGLTSVLPKLSDLKGLVSSGLGDMSGFTGKIADFKTSLGDVLHGHHGADVDVPPVRTEPSVETPVNAHGSESTVEAPPVREPELVGAGGHGESGTATQHGGGSESGSGSGSSGGHGSGHGGDSGSSGGSGHGTDAEQGGSGSGHGSDGDGAGTGGHGSDADGGPGHGSGNEGDAPAPAGSSGADGRPSDGTGEQTAGHDGASAAPAAYSHVAVDTAGNDISHLVSESGLSPSQLHDYLAAEWPHDGSLARSFEATGEWPHDVQIPKGPEVLSARGGIDWSDVDNDGFASHGGVVDRNEIVPAVGQVLDRYGPETGSFTSPVPDAGPFPYTERALPYLEDANQYHQYEVRGDLGDLRVAYDGLDPARQSIADDLLRSRGLSADDLSGLKTYSGEIAGSDRFGSPGGGVQTKLPLSVETLEVLGVLRELK